MDIMKVILDIENKAMDIIDSVDKTEEEKKAEEKISEMEKAFDKETNEKIAALKADFSKKIAEEVKATEKKVAMQEQRITDIYEMKHAEWISDLTKRVIEG